MTRQAKAYIYALLTVVLWSTIATASKLTLAELSPAELLCYASIVSTVVLFVVLILQNKISQLVQFSRKQWGISFLYGAINPFAYYLILFKAYDLLPAQQAQIINYTWAITLTVLSIPLLGHKVSKLQWLAILISYIGVLVIATKGKLLELHFENPFGIFLALLSTLLWAFYWILNTRDEREPIVGLFANFFCTLPLMIGYLAITEGLRIPTMAGVGGAVYIGTFEMGIAFVLWLSALKLTSSTAKIANLIFIAPFISLFLIHYLVGEEILASTLFGLVMVLVGLVIQSFAKEESGD